MSFILKRLGRLLPAKTKTGFAGYDLQGNSYFELPSPAGGRPKRTVEYKVNRDLAEYTSGQHRLPVQWTTWLSHTRTNAPSIEELESDTTRQSNLRPMIEAIEAREQAERIRQGYMADPALAPPSSQPRARSIAGPSQYQTNSPARVNARPSFTQLDTRPAGQTGQPEGSASQSTPQGQAQGKGLEYGEGGRRKSESTSDNVPPPSQPVDPIRNDDPAQLRKLAEEDTKRRIQERGGEGDLREQVGSVEGVGAGAGGLAPRRRGKK